MYAFVHLNIEQFSVDELETLIADASAELKRRNLPPVNEEETMMIVGAQPIQAIRMYKDRTGCGLRDAKAMIDKTKGTL
jgi:ribosomal protein L7/L12